MILNPVEEEGQHRCHPSMQSSRHVAIVITSECDCHRPATSPRIRLQRTPSNRGHIPPQQQSRRGSSANNNDQRWHWGGRWEGEKQKTRPTAQNATGGRASSGLATAADDPWPFSSSPSRQPPCAVRSVVHPALNLSASIIVLFSSSSTWQIRSPALPSARSDVRAHSTHAHAMAASASVSVRRSRCRCRWCCCRHCWQWRRRRRRRWQCWWGAGHCICCRVPCRHRDRHLLSFLGSAGNLKLNGPQDCGQGTFAIAVDGGGAAASRRLVL